jgi:hypothetical protein
MKPTMIVPMMPMMPMTIPPFEWSFDVFAAVSEC